MMTATLGGHDIDTFHPHHKTTAYWKEEFMAAGTYPLPPGDEAIMARESEFDHEALMPLVVKAQAGRRPRIKGAKELAMSWESKARASAKRRAAKATVAKPSKRRR